MDQNQWLNARFDAYAHCIGSIRTLSRLTHYGAKELRLLVGQEIDKLDRDLGRIDGLVMDNGMQPADHHP